MDALLRNDDDDDDSNATEEEEQQQRIFFLLLPPSSKKQPETERETEEAFSRVCALSGGVFDSDDFDAFFYPILWGKKWVGLEREDIQREFKLYIVDCTHTVYGVLLTIYTSCA